MSYNQIIDLIKDEKKKSIIKHSIINAIEHNNKCNPKAIIGKVIQDYPDVKKNLKDVMVEINELVLLINNLSKEDQNKIYEEFFKESNEQKKEKRREEQENKNIFHFFNIKDGDYVKTAYPPGPEKFPHIGHAKAALLNYMLAKQYHGGFSLRFEDTNPKLVKSEFYEIILENLEWLGIKYDELIYASDYMDLYRKFAEDLIKDDIAYMCFCNSETISKNRMEMKNCKCREKTPAQNLKEWVEFETYEPGKATLRLKINMSHKNSTMRDPSIFRIIDHPHARHGTKYRAWPSYDFQNSIMDGYLKISHRIRSKEFEMRSELHSYIRKLLDLYPTQTYEMARFDIIGMPLSGRVIRDLVQNSPLGWSDPTLGTIVALRRRGFIPKAIENFVVNTGINKSSSKVDLSDLIKQNKKILDNISKRYFAIKEPIEIKIKGAPTRKLILNSHPTKDLGKRYYECNENYLIEKSDFDKFKNNEVVRLIDNLNFKVINKDKKEFKYLNDDFAIFKKSGKSIIHFLPDVDTNINCEVLMPDRKIINLTAESEVKNLKHGDIIQFERFGFVKMDDKENLRFWFTHK